MYTNQLAFEEETGVFCWAFNHPDFWFRFETDAAGWAIKFMPLFDAQTLCDICQKLTETKVIGGNTLCSQEVTEAEWEQGKLYSDPTFEPPRAAPSWIARVDE